MSSANPATVGGSTIGRSTSTSTYALAGELAVSRATRPWGCRATTHDRGAATLVVKAQAAGLSSTIGLARRAASRHGVTRSSSATKTAARGSAISSAARAQERYRGEGQARIRRRGVALAALSARLFGGDRHEPVLLEDALAVGGEHEVHELPSRRRAPAI
jgi:hypothetical protein